MPKVTIIMPVYNAEKFLEKCLMSILEQTFQDWELIIVNDDSTDASLQIINRYINLREGKGRLRLINKINEGVSVARNVAIHQANGDYLYFCDGDDLLAPSAIEMLVNTMERFKASLVRADYIAIDQNDQRTFENKKFHVRKLKSGKILDSDYFYRKIVLDEFFLWLCLFRRDVIIENDFFFIPGCRYKEDVDFILHYLTKSPRNVYVANFLYFYRKYDASATGGGKDYTTDMKMIYHSLSLISTYGYVQKYMYQIVNPPSKFILFGRRLLTLLKYLFYKWRRAKYMG